MKSTVCTIALIAAGLAGPASAASEWIEIGSTGQNEKTYIDVASFRVIADTRRVWFKIEGDKPRPDGTIRTQILFSIKCATDEAKALSIVRYGVDGVIPGSASVAPSSAGYDPIIPDTITANAAEIICAVKD